MKQSVNSSIPKKNMDKILLDSLARTYGANCGIFRNESDFKMELFHQLAQKKFNQTRLAEKINGSETCYLHSEGKCENGNPAKADLLICNPFKFQKFNYCVDYIIELKHKLYKNDIAKELKKISKYTNNYKGIYIISAHKTNIDLSKFDNLIKSSRHNITIIQPDQITPILPQIPISTPSLNDSLKTIYTSINTALNLYGHGQRQYQGFYWCNYEHEENKHQTYPCEGDFVCQLFHSLKSSLPTGLKIISEARPVKSRLRIDLAVISEKDSWCIPIDIKMNWDQFKHKYDQKSGELKTAEAALIINRFKQLSLEYQKTKPFTIVIQGCLAQISDKKERSMAIFRRAAIKTTLICFDEKSREITTESLGE